MLEIALEGTTRLDSIGRRLRVATERKMIELTEIMYMKVIDNVTGKILHKQTGQLAASIHKQNDVNGDFYLGEVYVSPITAKATVLEKGGSKSYVIAAVNAKALHFFMKSGEERFATSVLHPPSKAFGYLQNALDEMEPLVPRGFRDSIQAVLDGGDYG